jgi:hypothetical protein
MDLDAAVLLALGSLSKRDQGLLLLIAWDALSREQVAAVLGLSKGTVAVRLQAKSDSSSSPRRSRSERPTDRRRRSSSDQHPCRTVRVVADGLACLRSQPASGRLAPRAPRTEKGAQ